MQWSGWILCFILIGCDTFVKRPTLHPKVYPKDIETLASPTRFNRKGISLEKEDRQNFPKNFYCTLSIALNPSISLQEAFIEMGSMINASLFIDPSIQSSIYFTAQNLPFIDIIKQLSFLCGLRYEMQGQTLCIFVDRPYSKTYDFQFLNCSRTSQNKISIATDVFSNSQTAKHGADNGSNSSINVTNTTDFWAELENTFKIILSGSDQAQYAIHKQAGLVSVFGKKTHHDRVEDYFKKLRKAITTQVLIEAKIIEVLLNDEFRAGINWERLASRGAYIQAHFGNTSQRFLDPQASTPIALGGRGENFSGILQALQEFGSQRILSSPRITVMNNQTAILKVAQNQVYFRLNYDKQFLMNVQRDSISVSSDIQTVPIGLVMSVQPSIDPKTGKVTIFLRPTVSRLSESVRDPAVDIAYASSNRHGQQTITPPVSKIPVVEVREIDSVLTLDSGEVGIFGGLMEAKSYQDKTKLPILGDIPLLGEAFQGNAEGNKITELVILIRATILDSSIPDSADKRLQHYMADPRPY